MLIVPALKNVIARNPSILVPMTTYITLCSFGLGLPAACAIFPQYGTIDASEVEERFQNITTTNKETGEKEVRRSFKYNKGL